MFTFCFFIYYDVCRLLLLTWSVYLNLNLKQNLRLSGSTSKTHLWTFVGFFSGNYHLRLNSSHWPFMHFIHQILNVENCLISHNSLATFSKKRISGTMYFYILNIWSMQSNVKTRKYSHRGWQSSISYVLLGVTFIALSGVNQFGLNFQKWSNTSPKSQKAQNEWFWVSRVGSQTWLFWSQFLAGFHKTHQFAAWDLLNKI